VKFAKPLSFGRERDFPRAHSFDERTYDQRNADHHNNRKSILNIGHAPKGQNRERDSQGMLRDSPGNENRVKAFSNRGSGKCAGGAIRLAKLAGFLARSLETKI